MNITNPWLTPYQRSYHQIKQKLIEGLKSITDSQGRQLITDVSEGNILVIVISMFAATEFITCASICGAFVVYYAIHIKRFKGNAVPFVIGFAIGSLFLLFAPGNFGRLETGLGITRKPFDIHYLLLIHCYLYQHSIYLFSH